MSSISIGLPNFRGFVSAHAHRLFARRFFSFFFGAGVFFRRPTTETPERILTRNMSIDVFSRKNVPFGVPKTIHDI